MLIDQKERGDVRGVIYTNDYKENHSLKLLCQNNKPVCTVCICTSSTAKRLCNGVLVFNVYVAIILYRDNAAR